MKNSLQRSVVFTERQAVYLRDEAKRLGISVADVIRRMIDNDIEKKGPQS